MTRTLAAIVAGFVAAVAFAASAAPASALTWNHAWRYMRLDDPGAWVARTIDLRGTYRWQVFGYHWAHPLKPAKTRTVRLHGRYAWDDVIVRRPATGRVQYYSHESRLRNVRTGGTVFLTHAFTAYGDGRYHFGSTIVNVRALR